jgi:hypothetical protein
MVNIYSLLLQLFVDNLNIILAIIGLKDAMNEIKAKRLEVIGR